MNKTKLFIIALVIIFGTAIIKTTKQTKVESEFAQYFSDMATQRQEESEKFTNMVVGDAEGKYVNPNAYKIEGSNWALPNIIRYWLGIDR